MKLNIGFIKGENQFLLKETDLENGQTELKTLDTIEIKETPLNLLFYPGESAPEGLEKTIAGEEKFYPVLSADSLGLDLDIFPSLEAKELADVFAKVNARWILNNNIQTIEQIYGMIVHLRELWRSDRSAFFEELWFVLKTNLAAAELTAVFHDVKEPAEDNNEKPSLINSYVRGTKTPQIFEGGEKEAKLMQDYENEFGESFEITEFDSSKGRLVATVKIGLSPILIMAKINTFNQLQRSLMTAIFSGLQAES